MKVDALLSRLEKVKRTGTGNWIACCPAHQDKHPSMTIAEGDEGRVLIHCFAGCDIEKILGAVGLDFDAVMPDKPLENRMQPVRRPFPAADVLACLATDAQTLRMAAVQIQRDGVVTDELREQITAANARIQLAVDYALGR